MQALNGLPQGETVHVVLGLYPRVHKAWARGIKVGPEILAVHVVEQLRDGRDVEDVEVQEVVTVYQLTKHWLAWNRKEQDRLATMKCNAQCNLRLLYLRGICRGGRLLWCLLEIGKWSCKKLMTDPARCHCDGRSEWQNQISETMRCPIMLRNV